MTSIRLKEILLLQGDSQWTETMPQGPWTGMIEIQNDLQSCDGPGPQSRQYIFKKGHAACSFAARTAF
jgi:hypothetical protein